MLFKSDNVPKPEEDTFISVDTGNQVSVGSDGKLHVPTSGNMEYDDTPPVLAYQLALG